jgi:hypothetical protein
VTQHRNWDDDDILYASFLDALQEFVGTLTANLRISMASVTAISIAAGTGSDQVAIAIGGRWRYITTGVTATASGSAGVKDVLAVASENVFNGAADTTDYTFGVQVVTTGGAASGNHNGRPVVASRKIGEVDWSGSAITGFRQTRGTGDTTLPITPTTPNGGVVPLRVVAPSGQTAMLFQALVNGVVMAQITPGGQLQVASVANLGGSGPPTSLTPASSDDSTKIATTAFVKSLGYTGPSGLVASNAAPLIDGTAAAGTSPDYARGDHRHPTDTSRAPVASPAFTGTPTAPTPADGDADTSIATTAFVDSGFEKKTASVAGSVTSAGAKQGTGPWSCSRTSIGGYTINLNNAMPDSNYAVALTGIVLGGGRVYPTVGSRSASSFTVTILDGNGSGLDCAFMFIAEAQ